MIGAAGLGRIPDALQTYAFYDDFELMCEAIRTSEKHILCGGFKRITQQTTVLYARDAGNGVIAPVAREWSDAVDQTLRYPESLTLRKLHFLVENCHHYKLIKEASGLSREVTVCRWKKWTLPVLFCEVSLKKNEAFKSKIYASAKHLRSWMLTSPVRLWLLSEAASNTNRIVC